MYLLVASFSSPPAPRCAGSPGTVACWPPQTHSPEAAGAEEPCHRLLASSELEVERGERINLGVLTALMLQQLDKMAIWAGGEQSWCLSGRCKHKDS